MTANENRCARPSQNTKTPPTHIHKKFSNGVFAVPPPPLGSSATSVNMFFSYFSTQARG